LLLVDCNYGYPLIANSWLCVVLQDANILDVFVHRVRQTFYTREEAYLFYLDYAKLAGFSVRIKRCNCNCWCGVIATPH
jgi:hypothetical protein